MKSSGLMTRGSVIRGARGNFQNSLSPFLHCGAVPASYVLLTSLSLRGQNKDLAVSAETTWLCGYFFSLIPRRWLSCRPKS